MKKRSFSMRSLGLVLTISLLISASAFANSAGITGFELFRMDGFARSSALAGSQIAVSGDLHNIYSNPSGLADIEQKQGSVSYFKHVLDINAGNLAYAMPFKNIGTGALGVSYLNYGKFDRADEHGQKLGDFGASDVLVTAALGRKLNDSFHGGVALKFLNSTIDNSSASAIAADFGVLYHTGYQDWDIAAGIYNVGTATSAFISHKDDLPTTYRLGSSVPLEHLPVRFALSGEYTKAEGVVGCGGLEFTFSQLLQARIGYSTIGIDQRVGLDRDALAGFSAGFGLHIQGINVDYALTSQGDVGFLNRFTIGTSFK
jgi:hypothetical protein